MDIIGAAGVPAGAVLDTLELWMIRHLSSADHADDPASEGRVVQDGGLASRLEAARRR